MPSFSNLELSGKSNHRARNVLFSNISLSGLASFALAKYWLKMELVHGPAASTRFWHSTFWPFAPLLSLTSAILTALTSRSEVLKIYASNR